MGALILMYHRVAEASEDPWGLCVTPEHFSEQLRVLREWSPVSLRQLVAGFERAELPADAVAVTFDDGYADNLLVAKPLLQQAGVPATCFLTTGSLGARGFWWDDLAQLLLRPGRLPGALQLNLEGTVRTWTLDRDAEYSASAAAQHRGWRTWEPPPTSRHSLYLSLWRALQPMPDARRRDLLAELAAWGGALTAERLLLTIAQVGELAAGELVEIGAHTVTHPVLSALPLEQQEAEVFRSKQTLEQLLGIGLNSFSYPYGMASEASKDLVRRAGFTSACATLEQPVRPESERWALPRVQVQDWSGEEFRSRISRWLAG